MLLKLLPIALALFTFSGAVSSARVSHEMCDHIDEPSNAYTEYNPVTRLQVSYTLKYQQGEYQEFENPWQYVDYDLHCDYVYSSDYSYSRINFKSITLRYFRTGPTDYDELNIPISETLNMDGTELSQLPNYFEFNVYTMYATTAFTCEFYFYYQVNDLTFIMEHHSTFLVDEEYAYNYYQESNTFTLRFQSFGDYSKGYEDGKTYVLQHLSEFNLHNEANYLAYGQQQYNLGAMNGTNFRGLFGAIADTPVIMIRSLFSFDLFGMSALTIFMSLLTALLVIHFVRKVI